MKAVLHGLLRHVLLPWTISAVLIVASMLLMAAIGFTGLCMAWVAAWALFLLVCAGKRSAHLEGASRKS